ncbi:MAG TPA: hypothetical protein VM325_14205 [Alphaproteobacteria bacterium]|nr:hypothetical protein [Alphaproteobacteria bacterium]
MLINRTIVAAALIAVTLPSALPSAVTAEEGEGLAARRRAARLYKPNPEYQRCASFSIRVLNACLAQYRNDPRQQRSCRQSYQSNMVGCQQANR